MISNRTYIEISGDALRYNFRELSKLVSAQTEKISVIKSNAYGHGLLQTAWALQPVTDWFAIDDIAEGKILRQHGIKKPILVLGAITEEWYPVARTLELTVTAPSLISVRWAMNHGVQTHIKLDTGLGRQGFCNDEEFQKLLSYIERNRPKYITGVYTHFAVADNPAEVDFTNEQFNKFQSMAESVEKMLGRKLKKHVSATSGVAYGDMFASDMVRFGIGLYGVWPSRAIQEQMLDTVLQSVMNWKATVSEVKSIQKGDSVGYDRTYRASRDMKTAIIPVGYWHGISRAFSNKGYVEIHGKRAPIIGNVSMDMIVVDVSRFGRDVVVGDTAILIGGGINAMDLSEIAGVSHYELLTCINPHIERRLR